MPDIHKRFNDIRFLRNRVMHYEAVFQRPHLAIEHAQIHAAIEWISPELHRGIHAVDSFPDIFLEGRGRVHDKLVQMLDRP